VTAEGGSGWSHFMPEMSACQSFPYWSRPEESGGQELLAKMIARKAPGARLHYRQTTLNLPPQAEERRLSSCLRAENG